VTIYHFEKKEKKIFFCCDVHLHSLPPPFIHYLFLHGLLYLLLLLSLVFFEEKKKEKKKEKEREFTMRQPVGITFTIPRMVVMMWIITIMMMMVRAQTPLALNQRDIINAWYKSMEASDQAQLNWNTTYSICTVPSNASDFITCNTTTQEIITFAMGSGVVNLNASIPASFANLTTLQTFTWGQNVLRSFPTEFFAGMTQMKILLLLGAFNNSLPPEIEVMTQLTYMSYTNQLVSGNEAITFTFPWTQVQSLTQLQYLIVILEPAYPFQLFSAVNLTQLTTLGLSGVNMTGPFPPYLLELGNLTSLGLANAGLTGTIPTGLINSPLALKLQSLELDENSLVGTIPSELFNTTLFPALQTLNFEQNSLQGTISTEWTTSGVTSLRVSENDLCIVCTTPTPPHGYLDFEHDVFPQCNYTAHLILLSDGQETSVVTTTTTTTSMATATPTIAPTATVTATEIITITMTLTPTSVPMTTTTAPAATTTATAPTFYCRQLKDNFQTHKCCDYLPL